jgi:hypothetical protein
MIILKKKNLPSGISIKHYRGKRCYSEDLVIEAFTEDVQESISPATPGGSHL